MNLVWALAASIIISLISLVGVIGLLLKETLLKRALIFLVAFGAGGLIGGAFLHLLPEAVENTDEPATVFLFTLVGFIAFFFLERYFFWRHCHEGKCDVHAFTYLNLWGDGVHNFIDGLIVGTSFIVSIPFGCATSLAIILHEIPQELGDFGVLIYGGFSKAKALLFNFLSAATAILGTVIGYYFAGQVGAFSQVLLPLAAGGFIYIAACDLIPELHKQPNSRSATFSLIVFLIGILMMFALKMGHNHSHEGISHEIHAYHKGCAVYCGVSGTASPGAFVA